jgi:hypothetical protein
MHPSDYAKLIEDVEHELLIGSRSIGILGLTRVTLQILNSLVPVGLVSAVEAVYTHEAITRHPNLPVPVRPLEDLTNGRHHRESCVKTSSNQADKDVRTTCAAQRI